MLRFEEHEIKEMWDTTIDRWERISDGDFKAYENESCVFCDSFYCYDIGERPYASNEDRCPISNINFNCTTLGHAKFRELYVNYEEDDSEINRQKVMVAARVFCDNLKLVRKGEYNHE